MDRFINTTVLNGEQLDSFMACCDKESRHEGYNTWGDPKMPMHLKAEIINRCLESCALPPDARKN